MDFMVPVAPNNNPEVPYVCKFPGCGKAAYHFVSVPEGPRHSYCEHHAERLLGVARAAGRKLVRTEILQIIGMERDE